MCTATDSPNVAAGDFALHYRKTHHTGLASEAPTYHDRLATLRGDIDTLGDIPDAERVGAIVGSIRDMKFDIEKFGMHCMIQAGEDDNEELLKTGRILRNEADRLWNTDSGSIVQSYVDDDRRDPNERAPSLDDAVEVARGELLVMRQTHLPLLIGTLDHAMEQL